jgi:23S rRNA pseudouridine1911/1915/1917 synthase
MQKILTLFENDNLLIIDKPAGIPSAPLQNSIEGTAVELALKICPALRPHPSRPYEFGLLNRLDTLTSGILVFAKHIDEYERLKKIWKTDVIKIYTAVSTHTESKRLDLPLTKGIILDFPLGNSNKSAKRMLPVLNPGDLRKIRGRELETKTEILEVSPTPLDEITGAMKIKLSIQTGVRHQIRCQLSTIGYPILGDPIYRGLPYDRLMLHASEIQIPDSKGITITVRSQFCS